MAELRLYFLIVVISYVGGGLALSVDKQQLLSRLHALRDILNELNSEKIADSNEIGREQEPIYLGEDYRGLSKRDPPSGFSAVRGKRKFHLQHGGAWQPRANSLEQYPFGDLNRDFLGGGQRDKKIPFHGGFMASRGKRSNSISKRSPVVDTLVNKARKAL